MVEFDQKLFDKYKINPKMAGSGVLGCVPQDADHPCPVKCPECFAFSGRSFLEPHEKNLPNMPDPQFVNKNGLIVRVNDLNDSNYQRELVMEATKIYERKFYNTAIPKDLEGFGDPVVLTINPAKRTDKSFYKLDPIPKNLMFVRVRINTWNLDLVDEAIKYYATRSVPVILTFMAYYNGMGIPEDHRKNYVFRKRTLNSYNAIRTDAWRRLMEREIEFEGRDLIKIGIVNRMGGNGELKKIEEDEKVKVRYENLYLVHSCGGVEGEMGKTSCKNCGNCLREYFATMERLRASSQK
jgi:hypothetical protein